MTKRALILSMMAASTSAAGLRGDGFEAVSELIEHFPPEMVHVDRRLVEDSNQTYMARHTMAEYFDEFPDLDIIGNVVEDPMEMLDEDYEEHDIPLEGPPKEYTPDPDRIIERSTRSANLGTWCKKVQSAISSPQGTCILSNGQRGHRLRVNIKTDKNGMETSFQVLRNSYVKMKMGPVVPANSQKTVEECLPAGKYTFKIIDLDGICCRYGEGGYTVSVDGTKLFDGGSFARTESREFTLGLDWLSTMSERDCEWWWAHDYRRRDWHTRCYPGYYCNKSYVPLRWSKGLARDAKVYANKLLLTCLDKAKMKHDSTDQGENMSKNVGYGEWGRLYEADKITKRFVENEEFWGWNRNAHLTQALWRASKYIGCSESVKDFGNNVMCRVQVCRFAKAGNCMMGQHNPETGNNWMIPVMQDDSQCGPVCPPDTGCFL